ncbi:hypothetical protein OG897_30970 [Streptomyces sp. NBC_00237]|uniref:hypothetical protein n=1 Tax=Streptomyces sp. NBC_00237 TaxID=2975687 RepID=UPI002251FB48|nr:hypothetical protein [Streptomyces sp. NBC_00237]MCX5205844.1 hypothetical protein [Streptomyces sp. NBC_00237]
MSEHDPRNWQDWASGRRQPPPAMFQAAPEGALDEERRSAIPDWAVNDYVAAGWRVENRSPSQAVTVRGEPVNNVLHAILTILSCLLWRIIWLTLLAGNRVERVALTVDEYGRVDVVTSPRV